MIETQVSGIAERLKLVRKAADMTQAQFAKAIGVSLRTYLHYEKGTREASLDALSVASCLSDRDFIWLITGKPGNQIELYEQAVLGTVECLEREGLSLPPRKMLVIARQALELAVAKGTKPADEVPKLVQAAKELLAS